MSEKKQGKFYMGPRVAAILAKIERGSRTRFIEKAIIAFANTEQGKAYVEASKQ